MPSSGNGFIALAFLVLVSTTVDDFIVLLMFCCRNEALDDLDELEKRKKYIEIAIGYLAGFTMVVGISLLGIVLSYFVQAQYIAFLGLIPFFMGLKMLYEYFYGDDDDDDEDGDKKEEVKQDEEDGNNNEEVSPGKEALARTALTNGDEELESGVSREERPLFIQEADEHHHHHHPQHRDSHEYVSRFPPTPAPERHNHEEVAEFTRKLEKRVSSKSLQGLIDNSSEDKPSEGKKKKKKGSYEDGKEDDSNKGLEAAGGGGGEDKEEEKDFIGRIAALLTRMGLSELMITVALTTMSVGSDNIVIYLSFFSQISLVETAFSIVIFYFMTISYAFVCIFFVKALTARIKTIEAFMNPVMPFVLMGLGLYILSDSLLAHVIEGKKK